MMMSSDLKFYLDIRKDTFFPGIFINWYLYSNQCLQGYGVLLVPLFFPFGFSPLLFGEGGADVGVWHLS